MRFIIPILVGGIIGYITNWIAIKMLFRPHDKKFFLGLPIPFTPGLIPKERKRLAKTIGETVGDHLLSPQVIMDSLYSHHMREYMKTWIRSNFSRLKGEDRSLAQLMEDSNYDGLLNSFRRKLADFICFQLRKDRFRERIIGFVEASVFNSFIDDIYGLIGEKVEEYLYHLSKSQEIRERIVDLLDHNLNKLANDERRLEDVVSAEYIHMVKESIYKYEKDIANLVRIILRDPKIEMKVKKSISHIINQNINKALAIFISPDMIAEKVFNAIREYVEESKIERDMGFILVAALDKLLECKVGYMAETLSKYDRKYMLSFIDTGLNYILDKEKQGKIVDFIDGKLKSQEASIKDITLSFLDQQLRIILNSEEFYENINLGVDKFLEGLINKPLSALVENVDEYMIINIFQNIMDIFNDFLIKKLPEIIGLFNISKVVEDQINSYDIEFVEELIIEIADRELKAITWLGGLLGGIMGLLTPLLQMIK